eukprot:jgi/Mesvir1/2683/Mv22862-RA.1
MTGLNVPQSELDYLLRATPNMNQQNLESLAIDMMLKSLQQPAPAAAPLAQAAYVTPPTRKRGPGRPPGAKNKPKVPLWETPSPATWAQSPYATSPAPRKPKKPRTAAPDWGWVPPPTASFLPPSCLPPRPTPLFGPPRRGPAPSPTMARFGLLPAAVARSVRASTAQSLAQQQQRQIEALFNTPALYTASSKSSPDAGIPPQVYMREWTNVDAAARAAQPATTPVGEILRSMHAGEKVATPSLIEARVDCASGVAKSLPRDRVVALAKRLYPDIPAQAIETATKADLCAMVADEAIESITKALCASTMYGGVDSKTRLASIAAFMTRAESPEAFAAMPKEALCTMISNMLKPEQRAAVMEKAGASPSSIPWKDWASNIFGAVGAMGEGLGSVGALQHLPQWAQGLALAGGVLNKDGEDRMKFIQENAGRFASVGGNELGLWDRTKIQANDAVNRGSESFLGRAAGTITNAVGNAAGAVAQVAAPIVALGTGAGVPATVMAGLQGLGSLANWWHRGKQFKAGEAPSACDRAYSCCVDAMDACHNARMQKLEAFLKKNRSRVYTSKAPSGDHALHQDMLSVSRPVCRRGVCSVRLEAGDGDYYTLCG